VFTPYGGWRTTDYIPVKSGDKIVMTISSQDVCYAIACYGKDRTVVPAKSIGGVNGVSDYSFTIPDGISFIRICFFNNINTKINIIRNTDIQKYYKKYDNIIRKPFDFNGKHAVWFGDSITYGYLAGAENNRTTVPFPKAFSEAVGLSSQFDYGNRGSNGATIVPTTSTQTNNLTNSVTNYPLDYYGTPDVVFIAGGTNDLALGTDWDDFESGMEDFLDAVNTKFAASIPVVFITPINARAAILGTSHPLSELVKIRNIMTTAILKKDVYDRFSIIQGDKLPFPLMTEDTAMSDILFSDGVHLSEYGYKVYSAYLQGVLC
jgi:lysophospholipase L1-like esterase